MISKEATEEKCQDKNLSISRFEVIFFQKRMRSRMKGGKKTRKREGEILYHARKERKTRPRPAIRSSWRAFLRCRLGYTDGRMDLLIQMRLSYAPKKQELKMRGNTRLQKQYKQRKRIEREERERESEREREREREIERDRERESKIEK